MQKAPQAQPLELQLPLMYAAPQKLLSMAYAYADDLSCFDAMRRLVEGEGAALKLVYTYLEPQQKRFFGAFVLDLSGAPNCLPEITRKLDHLPGVKTVDVGAASRGLVGLHGAQLQVAGTPVAVMARQFLGDTHKRLVEALGNPAETTLCQAGEAAGCAAAAAVPSVAHDLGISLNPTVLRERFSDLQIFGWATVVALHVDSQFIGEALLSDDFEACAWHGQAKTSQCHWIRGFLTGSLSRLVGKPIHVSEPECQAKGDHYCRFTFRP